jgi:enoyl-CoA hydratase/carnithine racemase
MPSTVRLSIGEGVAVVTLADPGRRNALSKQLSDELAAAVREAERRVCAIYPFC